MTAILALLWSGALKLLGSLPWPVWALLGAFGLVYGSYLYGEHASTTAWEARWAARESDYAKAAAQAKAQNAADLRAANARNQEILDAFHKVADDRDAARADADLAHRLLDAARSASGGGSVPEAGHQSGTPPAGGPGGAAPAPDLSRELAAVFDECVRNADQLDALIGEIKPQL